MVPVAFLCPPKFLTKTLAVNQVPTFRLKGGRAGLSSQKDLLREGAAVLFFHYKGKNPFPLPLTFLARALFVLNLPVCVAAGNIGPNML